MFIYMKLIDCFTFTDEEVVLDLRLNVLNKIVDKFIITEGTYDHRGNKRNLIFDIKKYNKFRDKIIYLKVSDFPNFNDPWDMLRHQRNFAINEIKKFSENDYVMCSDVDEIPNPKSIKCFMFQNKRKIGVFMQKLFYYKFNYLCNDYETWFGTKITKVKNLKTPQLLHGMKTKIYPWWRVDKPRNPLMIKNGGWHFSFLYDVDGIIKKISSYQHTEYDNDDIKDKDRILSKIESGDDIFNRGYKYKKIEIDNSFPDYLIQNQIKFSHWIKK